MLCGEFHKAPLGLYVNFASLSDSRSPYSSLLTLVQSMAALTAHAAHEEEDIFLENGLLSYENPNYHLDPTRIDDALNSNTNIYEDIYQELDDICNIGHSIKEPLLGGPGRKAYAALDIGTMGVDITSGPLTHISSSNINDNKSISEKTAKNNKDNQQEKVVPHIPGQLNNDLYAVPVKKKNQKCPEEIEIYSPDKESADDTDLPPGWEKHEDNDGPYYWHIKSGTIQREVPVLPESEKSEKSDTKQNINKENDVLMLTFENSLGSVTRSSTSSALDLETEDRKRKNDMSFKRRSYPSKPEQEARERPIRFAVRSLGWVEIAEEDLTPERSSKAVNKCIVDLSVGKNDLLDVVGRWGDGKDLFMDLDEGALKLIDPENLTVLNTQPIHTIRVWGVGRDNGR
jgi:amyloid beta (A4) precursor protein-binding family B protein 2 (Fe65-like)